MKTEEGNLENANETTRLKIWHDAEVGRALHSVGDGHTTRMTTMGAGLPDGSGKAGGVRVGDVKIPKPRRGVAQQDMMDRNCSCCSNLRIENTWNIGRLKTSKSSGATVYRTLSGREARLSRNYRNFKVS